MRITSSKIKHKQNNFKKKLLSKKACKTCDLSHETKINS